jgi:hypothetical protein
MPLVGSKRCRVCKLSKPLEAFYKRLRNKNKSLYGVCKKCQYVKLKHRLDNDPRFRILNSSRLRAYTQKLVHKLHLKDIPMPIRCKYLDLELDYRCSKLRNTKTLHFPET